MDLMNSQMVGVNGDDIVIMLPKQRMSMVEALVHAAWIVALADNMIPDGPRFQSILDLVLKGGD